VGRKAYFCKLQPFGRASGFFGRGRSEHIPMNNTSSRRSALDKASPGDILLFHHARGLNRLITMLSGSPYHHVGLYAGNRRVIESRVGGVINRDLSAAKVRLRFRVIPAPGGPQVGRAAVEWAQTQIGARYAYGSIFALFFDRLLERAFGPLDIIWRQSDRVSCGELVAQAYEMAGVPLFPGCEPEEIAPWDFASLLKKTGFQKSS
jgi:hypothetical protein